MRPAVDALDASRYATSAAPTCCKRHGHYELWLNRGAGARAAAQARYMEKLEVPTAPAPANLLEAAQRRRPRLRDIAGLWFPKCAHVVDPLEVVRAFAEPPHNTVPSVVRRNVRSAWCHAAARSRS